MHHSFIASEDLPVSFQPSCQMGCILISSYMNKSNVFNLEILSTIICKVGFLSTQP